MAKIVELADLPNWVGKELEPSDWLEIDQERVNQFAAATNDFQFIHVDEERAAKTPFGGTIAHGFLSLSMLSYFAESVGCVFEDSVMGINYGFDKVRFLAPVKVNKRVRAHGLLLDVQEKKPGHFLIKQKVTIDIEGETTPALMAEWLTLSITN